MFNIQRLPCYFHSILINGSCKTGIEKGRFLLQHFKAENKKFQLGMSRIINYHFKAKPLKKKIDFMHAFILELNPWRNFRYLNLAGVITLSWEE